MSEREDFPTPRALAAAREEQTSLASHVAYPGRVQSYNAATQTADVVPLIRQQVPQPDGSYEFEELPVLPSVPVIWPRVGGWFLAFALAEGDTVQLLCNTSAIGHWRVGNGDVTDPGDLRRQHLAHAVAIPGLYTSGRKLSHAPTGTAALTIGSDAADGARVVFRTNGDVEITPASGRNVILAGGTLKAARVTDPVRVGTLSGTAGPYPVTFTTTLVDADGVPGVPAVGPSAALSGVISNAGGATQVKE